MRQSQFYKTIPQHNLGYTQTTAAGESGMTPHHPGPAGASSHIIPSNQSVIISYPANH